VDDEESPNPVSNTHWKDNEDVMPIVTSLTMDAEEPESLDHKHNSWTTERAAAAAEKKAGLQQFQTALRQKLTPKVWTSAGALDQWLSGRNKRQPCRKLATLDPLKVREWIGPGHLTPFVKECPFVIWRQGVRDIEFSLLDPNPVTGTSEGRRIVPPPPPSGPVRNPLPYTPLRQNPTDIRRQESTIQRTKLVDWITVRLGSRVPSQDEERDIQRAKGRRLHRDLRGFDEPTERKNEDPTLTPSEQLLQEGKDWFLDRRVGPFLDRVRNLARGPERERLPKSQSVRLYVSNLRARTKDDIITKLKGTGLQILREDLAKFEMKYSRKLRLETTALTILVRSDSKLEDIMQGRVSMLNEGVTS
jgi:hypothetical protein